MGIYRRKIELEVPWGATNLGGAPLPWGVPPELVVILWLNTSPTYL